MTVFAMAANESKIRRRIGCAAATAALVACVDIARADEGGVSFWIPGNYGSLAATPQVPGWALGVIYYHTTVAASGSVAAAKEILTGRIPATVNVNLNLSLSGQGDLVVLAPSYTFATPVLGGQLNVGVSSYFGRKAASIAGTLTAVSGSAAAMRMGTVEDALTSYGDLIPAATLRWNQGVNNFMTYVTGDVPVGDYNSMRLANLGIGHGAIDVGGGLHLSQSDNRKRILRRCRFYLQFQKPGHAVSKRHRFPLRLGRVAFPLEAGFRRPRRLCLPANHRRLRSIPDSGWLQVTRARSRPADRLYFPGGRHAGLSGRKGLRRIRCVQSCVGLEHVADVCDFAGGAH